MKKISNSLKYKILLEQLYQVRANVNMTQKALAYKLVVPQSFISKVESGERRLDIIELAEYCRCLDTDLIEFVKQLENKINASKE